MSAANNSNELLNTWISLTNIQTNINDELERVLEAEYGLSLKEFFVLYFLMQTDEKKLRLQQLQDLVGLSQSAISRLVGRMEAENCGALNRHICEDDRRGIYTCITGLGQEKFRKALVTFNEMLETSLKKGDLKQQIQSLIQKL